MHEFIKQKQNTSQNSKNNLLNKQNSKNNLLEFITKI